MTDYAQLQAVFTALGIPFKAITEAEAFYQPYHCLEIDSIEFWFNSRGDFLQIYQSQYDDTLKVLRKGGGALWDDDIIARNRERAEQADAVQQQKNAAERERQASIFAQQRAEYRARYPLNDPTYAAIALRAQAMVTSGETPTFEQAVDKVAQEDPELFALVVFKSRIMVVRPKGEELTAEEAVRTGRIADYVFPIIRHDLPRDSEFIQADCFPGKDDNACS